MPNMEQRKIKNDDDGLEDAYRGVGIHSQVRKIKQEIEKIDRLELQQPEVVPSMVRQINCRRVRSRSPLGLAERPIPIGN
ncbi:hypothetical protein OROGR_001943 [Orobanche gracilis]